MQFDTLIDLNAIGVWEKIYEWDLNEQGKLNVLAGNTRRHQTPRRGLVQGWLSWVGYILDWVGCVVWYIDWFECNWCTGQEFGMGLGWAGDVEFYWPGMREGTRRPGGAWCSADWVGCVAWYIDWFGCNWCTGQEFGMGLGWAGEVEFYWPRILEAGLMCFECVLGGV